MKYDAFSRCHPAVNFLYFVIAIAFGVVIQHPVYLAAGCMGAGTYYLLLTGQKGARSIVMLLPVFAVLSLINPLFNTAGEQVLLYVFGRPYTLEALLFGMAIAAMFVIMMIWFGCYNRVLTGDKFTSLFGSAIPSISLLLVMILRLIPAFLRKVKQISGARDSIGRGVGTEGTLREKLASGMLILSALTDWTLEGSVVTADSMRARGYGTAGRTSYRRYRMTAQDVFLLALMLMLAVAVIAFGGMDAAYTPTLYAAPIGWGFGAYCVFLLIPTVLHLWEAVTWRILRSKI